MNRILHFIRPPAVGIFFIFRLSNSCSSFLSGKFCNAADSESSATCWEMGEMGGGEKGKGEGEPQFL